MLTFGENGMGRAVEGVAFDLSRLDDGQLVELFRSNGDDHEFLEALNEELKRRSTELATELHIAVAEARRASAKAAPTSNAPDLRPVRTWLSKFLGARNLTRPTGKPLYRYRMTDGEYERAKQILRHLARARRLAEPDARAGALFVAYCAEWFRRESASTFLRWDDPAPDLFPSVPYASKQQLATYGLEFWERPLRKSVHAREFLLTVALEGGFPVRILESAGRGWLKEYLRAIMRRAIAWHFGGYDEIHAIAEDERGRMRKSYQHDDFVALCSELVVNLLELRRKAEALGTQEISNSQLLDLKYAGWREDLPIYVPEHDEALITELLSGLLNEKMTGLATEGVETRRYLIREDGAWLPALQLLADGEVPTRSLAALSTDGRVRAVPTGELANHVASEIALLEPPASGQRSWRVRPFMRTTRLLRNYPLGAPVTVTLSAKSNPPFLWTWPKGEAVRSDLLIFIEDENATPQQPMLRFIKAGSVRSPHKTLYALIPDDWQVEPSCDGAVTEIEAVPGLGCKLVRLSAAAYFTASDDESAKFLVEPDVEASERQLELVTSAGHGFVLADRRQELVVAGSQPRIHEAGKQTRIPIEHELFARRPGTRWSPVTGPLTGDGLFELSLRDRATGIQLEKRWIVLAPDGARISGRMTDASHGEIRLHGLLGWTASIEVAGCEMEESDGSTLAIRFTGAPIYRLPVTLHPPDGPSVGAVISLVGRDAAIALADGSILKPLQQVDVGALRGATVVTPRRTTLRIAAKGSRTGGIQTVIDGEFPLAALRGAAEEILATLPQQDDLIELEFLGDSRPPIRVSRYRSAKLTWDGSLLHWQAESENDSILPVARMVEDPRHEHALEAVRPGLWRIPERCKGFCLIYLRDGIDVVSRPILAQISGLVLNSECRLISALSVPDHEERQRRIADALTAIGDGQGHRADITWLRDSIGNRNGLPASAFDALKLLPANEKTLTYLLINARDAEERNAVWSLQNELPFLWLALPLSAWGATMETSCHQLADALKSVVGEQDARREAVKWLQKASEGLMDLEPALGAILRMAGLPLPPTTVFPPLNDLASAYIRDHHYREESELNEHAARLAGAGLAIPEEIASKSHENFAGLFAPIFLAASAQGRLRLRHEERLLIRRTLRENPQYVTSAWPQLLKFYGSAQS